jgi:catechol 2,3-dioxygenase-like lactoylglutathione lyase family enzyme
MVLASAAFTDYVIVGPLKSKEKLMSTPPGVKFIYLFCNDLQKMRHFYTDLVGLKEIYYSEDPDGTVAYDCDGLQFTIMLDPKARNATQAWARQPGWEGGNQPSLSWSICLTENEYGKVIKKLQEEVVVAFYEQPQWQGYWSFPVKDPMGNTVEVVLAPDEEPENTVWP